VIVQRSPVVVNPLRYRIIGPQRSRGRERTNVFTAVLSAAPRCRLHARSTAFRDWPIFAVHMTPRWLSALADIAEFKCGKGSDNDAIENVRNTKDEKSFGLMNLA
jgi:hypothetical protein